MTGPVSTAAAATLAPASVSAPPAGWASNASTAGAASGEWEMVSEVEAKGRSKDGPRPEAGAPQKLGGRGLPHHVSGPLASRKIFVSGLGSSVLEVEKLLGRVGAPQRDESYVGRKLTIPRSIKANL